MPRVRELMKKGVTQPVIERILGDAYDAGIRVRALCMLGYPGETAAEIRETFAFLARVEPLLASVSMTPFFLMRRAPMAQAPARFGLTLIGQGPPAAAAAGAAASLVATPSSVGAGTLGIASTAGAATLGTPLEAAGAASEVAAGSAGAAGGGAGGVAGCSGAGRTVSPWLGAAEFSPFRMAMRSRGMPCAT